MSNPDELVYRPQIAKMLGLTDKQAEKIVWSETFPSVAHSYRDGRPAVPAWRRRDVEDWIARRQEQVT